MTHDRIAIVGIALTYPDATTTGELWENVLAGRRAFRDIPPERTNLQDYWDADPAAVDQFYSRKAAVLRDYEFDRIAHRISAGTFRVTDMTHWLALDVVGRAFADAGFPHAAGLPGARTGVVIGNTLTGEFSRANLMRLRWPYVRRAVAAQLGERGWSAKEVDDFVIDLERQYKAPFPSPTEDTLAGGLANTIAGRVCNYFDLGGGGYTVDGACSSSLLSVTNAATALTDGMLDVAVAGGVDLSIDPFELVGFARTGALATGEMRVYDAGSNGFWPGEGCGMVVLMRESDARAQGRPIYACLSGWGISSDGKGGITRPEAAGHRRAIDQAYTRAGYSPDTVGYFEGHGTGTAVGDETEIRALAGTRDGAGMRAAIGSIKANIGHTKAAAGIAGLIKAALAVHHRTIPPITGHVDPHPALIRAAGRLFAPREALSWPTGGPVRAGVSAMGFGGINTHIALEQADLTKTDRPVPDGSAVAMVRGRQKGEVFLLAAEDSADLERRVGTVRDRLTGAAMCELLDVAAAVATSGPSAGAYRAGLTAESVEEAVTKLERILERLASGEVLDGIEQLAAGCYVGRGRHEPRIGFVFPGQGAGVGRGGAVIERFGGRALDAVPGQDGGGPGGAGGTGALQPRVVARSLDVLELLESCGVTARVAAGHSLGEITALAWAGAVTAADAVEIASARGVFMERMGAAGGAMAAISAAPVDVARLIDGTDVRVTGYNAPELTVIGGRAVDVDAVSAAAARSGVGVARLDVEHAFHTDDFRAASIALRDRLAGQAFDIPTRRILSTSTGRELAAGTDLARHLADQMLRPVRFTDAVRRMEDLDLVIEVGPGHALRGLVAATLPRSVVTGTDSDHPDIMPFLDSVAAAHTAGCEVRSEVLVAGRAVRPFDLDREATFLMNPCEAVPRLGFTPTETVAADTVPVPAGSDTRADAARADDGDEDTLGVLRRRIAEQVELPLDLVTAGTKPLDELHMSSITVGQVVNDVVRALGRPALSGVPSFATASVREIAVMLDEAHESDDHDREVTLEAPGVMPWVRPFAITDVPAAPPPAVPSATSALAPRSTWTSIGTHAAADGPLLAALSGLDGPDGLLADVRSAADQDVLDTVHGLLSDVGEAIRSGRTIRVVVLRDRRHAVAGLVKSLHLEHPAVSVTIVTLPDVEGPNPSDVVPAEVARNPAFVEVMYDAEGRRTVPRLTVVEDRSQDVPLRTGDVLLATGGAKGITAEACLEIGRRFDIAVAIVGRAPADSPAVAATRERFERAEVRHLYVSADVLEPDQLARAVTLIERELGTVTAVLHGAGVNNPKPALDLDTDDLVEALGPKVTGLRNVLDVVDVDRLRLVVGFASIIGRTGLFGEGHYALANAWLTDELEDLARRRPHVRVRSLEWSVWAGTGMGERLGVIERLRQQGIEAISTADGLDELLRAVSTPGYPVTSVICSRTGSLPTVAFTPRELPLSRFLERVVVHYPGVELIAEADLAVPTDRYLPDHQLGDDLLLPAVLGMEAMAQVASGLVAADQQVSLTNVLFERPIVVPPHGTETVRVCAVVARTGEVRLVVRTAATDFAVDHFSATLRFATIADPDELVSADAVELPDIRMDPQTELYGDTMFQGPRFQRITGYQRAAAREATVGIGSNGRDDWFAAHLPSGLVLGDPGIRDALMHALQCCVPDATLLPHGVERIEVGTVGRSGPLTMRAKEREGDGEWFVYDLVLRDKTGSVVETWRGLRLRAVSRRASGTIAWTPTLLGPYLERGAEKLLGGTRTLVVEPHGDRAAGSVAERRTTTALAARRAWGDEIEVTYRADGRPECSDGSRLSATHCEGLTLVARSDRGTAVDAERVLHRSVSAWRDLLGERAFATARQLADVAREDLDRAATRVWGALECLRKTGRIDPVVHLGSVHDDGWVRFTVGDDRIATWVGRTRRGGALAVAILSGG